MSVGVRPSLALAQEAGLATGRGILVDDRMATSRSADLRAGRVRRAPGPRLRPRGAAYEQAEALARPSRSGRGLRGHAPRHQPQDLGAPGLLGRPRGHAPGCRGGHPLRSRRRALPQAAAAGGPARRAVFVGDIAEQAACKALIRSASRSATWTISCSGAPRPAPRSVRRPHGGRIQRRAAALPRRLRRGHRRRADHRRPRGRAAAAPAPSPPAGRDPPQGAGGHGEGRRQALRQEKWKRAESPFDGTTG